MVIIKSEAFLCSKRHAAASLNRLQFSLKKKNKQKQNKNPNFKYNFTSF